MIHENWMREYVKKKLSTSLQLEAANTSLGHFKAHCFRITLFQITQHQYWLCTNFASFIWIFFNLVSKFSHFLYLDRYLLYFELFR